MLLKSYAILDQLPFGVRICSHEGLLEHQNSAAAAADGSTGIDGVGRQCCDSLQLYRRNGTPLAPEDYPVLAALRGDPDSHRLEVLVEKPDGSVIEAVAFATPRLGEDGAVAGAICVLVESADRSFPLASARHLAALVESSDDAIVSTNRDLSIAAWNRGAARLFGYASRDVVGRHLEILVPEERRADEAAAARRVLGEARAERFDTERVHSDGSRIDVSVTLSPILDHRDEVVGISQISRSLTELHRTLERQELLIAEMNHRVKNLLILAGGIVSLGARTAKSVQALASDVTERFATLARAHELTLPRNRHSAAGAVNWISLHALIETILAPFEIEGADGSRRIEISGEDVMISAGAPMTGMALLLHEFSTNAAKYGALARASGTIRIHSAATDERVVLTWTEQGGPSVTVPSQDAGFGSRLIDITVRRQLSAELIREWHADGLVIRLSIELHRLKAAPL